MQSASSHYDVKVALSNIMAHLLADKGPAMPSMKQRLAVEVLYTLKWETAFERYRTYYSWSKTIPAQVALNVTDHSVAILKFQGSFFTMSVDNNFMSKRVSNASMTSVFDINSMQFCCFLLPLCYALANFCYYNFYYYWLDLGRDYGVLRHDILSL